jgi:hypothetical protein
VVFLVDRHVLLDAAPWALQRSGHGFVVAQGEARYTLGDWSRDRAAGRTLRVGAHHRVDRGGVRRRRDACRLRRDGLKAALALATRVARDRRARPRVGAAPPPRLVADAAYADLTAPPVEYRLLALYRVWNVIGRFYPYLHADRRLGRGAARDDAAVRGRHHRRRLRHGAARARAPGCPTATALSTGIPSLAKVLLRGEGFLAVELRWIDKQRGRHLASARRPPGPPASRSATSSPRSTASRWRRGSRAC